MMLEDLSLISLLNQNQKPLENIINLLRNFNENSSKLGCKNPLEKKYKWPNKRN